MSMKYGISHHNFGPYPGEDADAAKNRVHYRRGETTYWEGE